MSIHVVKREVLWLEEGESGVPVVVEVRDEAVPDLTVVLKVFQVNNGGVAELRLAWFHAASRSGSEEDVRQTFLEAGWMARVFDAVLEDVTMHSTAVERAIERNSGLLLYGWAGDRRVPRFDRVRRR